MTWRALSSRPETWAKANGCPWNEETCALAALYGHLDALKWAREHGCSWDEETCATAAVNGHLEVLQWAREHHCPWNGMTLYAAEYNGHREVLRWAREHGCPDELPLVSDDSEDSNESEDWALYSEEESEEE